MQSIRLLNPQGEFVHGASITGQDIPDVIIWGTRTFKFTGSSNKGKNTESVLEYTECYTYHLSS